MEQDIPPLADQYGDQLQILIVNIQTEGGQQLYRSAVSHFRIPESRLGVPALIVGETVLVGSAEIPEMFPALIEDGLSQGGIPWPAIPGLREILEVQGIVESRPLTMGERFARDPLGNSLSVLVLVGMVVSLILAGYATLTGEVSLNQWPDWVIPTLLVIGLSVAGYLAFVEVTETEAVCGPIGDCNTVQSSPYAYLFGVIPIGLLGVIGYLFMAGLWLIQRIGAERWSRVGSVVLWGIALSGTLFSVYLTFLEPFVIGATCAWCLSSAIVMTIVLWATTPGASQAWRELRA
jgi:uncharacterized membrane protein